MQTRELPLVIRHSARFTRWFCVLLCVLPLLVACTGDMYEQPRYDPLEPGAFFEDNRSARPLPLGVVALGDTQTDTHLYTGRVNNQFVTSFPFPVTREVMYRGQERFNIYCSPCHGLTGEGNGMIAQRSERLLVPSLHQQRLRDAPDGFLFEVITNGYRYMYGYATRVSVEDRWAIVAYVRALQRSHQATLEDIPLEERTRLEQEQ